MNEAASSLCLLLRRVLEKVKTAGKKLVGKFNGFLTVLLVVFPMSLDYLLGLRKIASIITDSLAQSSQAIFQVGYDCSIFWVIVLVDGLEAILAQVVQFPCRGGAVATLVIGPVVVDQFVFLGAYADVARVVVVAMCIQ